MTGRRDHTGFRLNGRENGDPWGRPALPLNAPKAHHTIKPAGHASAEREEIS